MLLSTRRRGGLRGLGDPAADIAAYLATHSSGCSWWSFYFDKPAWLACVNAAGVAQIQSVPQNAQAAGYPQPVIDVAQATADEQSGMVPADNLNIGSFYGAGQLLYTPGNQTALPTWAWIALAVAGGLVVVKMVK